MISKSVRLFLICAALLVSVGFFYLRHGREPDSPNQTTSNSSHANNKKVRSDPSETDDGKFRFDPKDLQIPDSLTGDARREELIRRMAIVNAKQTDHIMRHGNSDGENLIKDGRISPRVLKLVGISEDKLPDLQSAVDQTLNSLRDHIKESTRVVATGPNGDSSVVEIKGSAESADNFVQKLQQSFDGIVGVRGSSNLMKFLHPDRQFAHFGMHDIRIEIDEAQHDNPIKVTRYDPATGVKIGSWRCTRDQLSSQYGDIVK